MMNSNIILIHEPVLKKAKRKINSYFSENQMLLASGISNLHSLWSLSSNQSFLWAPERTQDSVLLRKFHYIYGDQECITTLV